jgi:hypothetical protein
VLDCANNVSAADRNAGTPRSVREGRPDAGLVVTSRPRALLAEARVTVPHHALQLVGVVEHTANQFKKLDDDHCGLLFKAGA